MQQTALATARAPWELLASGLPAAASSPPLPPPSRPASLLRGGRPGGAAPQRSRAGRRRGARAPGGEEALSRGAAPKGSLALLAVPGPPPAEAPARAPASAPTAAPPAKAEAAATTASPAATPAVAERRQLLTDLGRLEDEFEATRAQQAEMHDQLIATSAQLQVAQRAAAAAERARGEAEERARLFGEASAGFLFSAALLGLGSWAAYTSRRRVPAAAAAAAAAAAEGGKTAEGVPCGRPAVPYVDVQRSQCGGQASEEAQARPSPPSPPTPLPAAARQPASPPAAPSSPPASPTPSLLAPSLPSSPGAASQVSLAPQPALVPPKQDEDEEEGDCRGVDAVLSGKRCEYFRLDDDRDRLVDIAGPGACVHTDSASTADGASTADDGDCSTVASPEEAQDWWGQPAAVAVR